MKITVVGLGKMGVQIAKKLHESGFEIIAHNKSRDKVDEAKMLGMTAAYTKEEVVSSFNKERVIIWLMLPSEIVDQELDIWLKLIPKNSILIDGGNSDFRHTKERAKKVSSFESTLVDVGTSGGIWGYKNGFSMMAGGSQESYDIIVPLLEALSKPNGAYYRFGESGAGHYVKMVHNAIEYGMMESLAEGYRLLKEGSYKDIDLASAGDVWQHHSVVSSWLNELTRDVLKENPELKGVEGYVSESGEARWALELARSLNIETPAIRAAFDVRLESQKGKTNFATKLLAAMRNAFGGHQINKDK